MILTRASWLRLITCGAAAIALGAAAGEAAARTSDASQGDASWAKAVHVRIQARPLAEALNEVARQTGVSILFAPEKVEGLSSASLEGRMTARQAVERLTAGRGFEVVSNGEAALVVRAAGDHSRRAGVLLEPEATLVDDIIVTAPIRDSIARSLAVQRNSPNAVNVIAADTIGRFPDQTAAAALARLPGVAVQRDQGQERYIQVRGAPTRWTSTAFNGVNVLGGDNRIFRFDSVPATLIDQVILNKTLTPAMPADALSGRVDIRTYRPLDRQGFDAQLEVGTGLVDMGGGHQGLYGGRVAWADDRWGFVLAGSHYEFEQETDNAEPRYDAAGVSQLRAAKYITLRETNALSGTLEFQPAEGHRLSLTSLFTEFDDHEQRNQYTFYFTSGEGRRSFDGGELTGVEVRGLFNDGGATNSTFYNVLHGEHELGAWRVDWNLSLAESEVSSGSPLIEQRQSASLRSSLRYKLGQGNIPTVSLFDTDRSGASPTFGGRRTALDQLAFDEERLTWSGSKRTTEERGVKLDFQRDWSGFGGESTFAFGAQYNDREYRDVGSFKNTTPGGAAGLTFSAREVAAELGFDWDPLSFVTMEPVDERFHRGFTFNYLDNPGLRAQAEALFDAARAANGAGADYAVPELAAAEAFTIKEKALSAYAQNTWRSGRHTILAGLRVEQVKVESDGSASNGGGLTPLSLSSDDVLVFPSLHWNMDVSDDLKLRAAFVSGSARPSFSDQSANSSIDDVDETISGGNPYLKSEKAWGLDGAVEWYFAPSALLAANAFYRDVSDVLFSSSRKVGDTRYDGSGFSRGNYDYTSMVNGDNGKLYGLELTYYHPWTFLPGPLSGLGVEASVAFLDGEFTTPTGRNLPFPGTSDRLSNLSVFYEKYGLSARVSYQHRTGWIDEVTDAATSDMYWDATERVDISIRYQVTPMVTLFMDGNNLNDAQGRRYIGSSQRTYELEGFGRRYLVGVRARF